MHLRFTQFNKFLPHFGRETLHPAAAEISEQRYGDSQKNAYIWSTKINHYPMMMNNSLAFILNWTQGGECCT